MNARDWFGVGVRLLGVWCFIQAVQNLLYFFDVKSGLSPLRDLAGQIDHLGSPFSYLVYAVGYLVLTAYFLFGSEHLADWCYRKQRQPSETVRDAHKDEESHAFYDPAAPREK